MSYLDCSRSEARALFDGNAVTLNGRRARKGDRASAGDEVIITFKDAWVVPEPELALDVRLTRPELVVVSKPAGMPSAPLAPGERGTLVNALVARFPEMLGIGYTAREAGLLHRLDTETSGLLVAARSAECFQSLLAGLRSGELRKRYLAVVESAGLPNTGTIDFPLGPHPSDPRKVAVAESPATYRHEAETRYHVLERGPRWALVELDAARAFRHQVRAHLAAIGHPIAGDVRYGGRTEAPLGARHALHASRIEWASRDIDVAPFSVVDEVPASFVSLLREDR
jgi:23S rRNA pseudouridine1911/1915/1917 synthase